MVVSESKEEQRPSSTATVLVSSTCVAARRTKRNDPRGNRTLNLRDWNPTRCHCAIESFTAQLYHETGFCCLRYLVRPSTGAVVKQKGAIRESNPRPPAPKAGIIPLDQSPDSLSKSCTLGDSNPRPHRGSELESDALTNSAKGALLPVPLLTPASS